MLSGTAMTLAVRTTLSPNIITAFNDDVFMMYAPTHLRTRILLAFAYGSSFAEESSLGAVASPRSF
jgi:hypothetical protein